MAAGLTVGRRGLKPRRLLNEWLAGAVARASAEQETCSISAGAGGLTTELVAASIGMSLWHGWRDRGGGGPVKLVNADIVGTDHLRVIAAGEDGRSFKAIAFRAAESALGQTLLHGARGRRLWLAGRAKIDDWGNTPKVELHLEDAAFAD